MKTNRSAHSPQTASSKQRQPPPNRLQRWWERHHCRYRYAVEQVPFDWANPEAGSYLIERRTIEWHGRQTTCSREQRRPHQPINITWNSEHLAYWWGERTSKSGRQADGQDVDWDDYTLKSVCLGTHHYSD